MSSFATAQQETQYNKLLFATLFIVSKSLVVHIQNSIQSFVTEKEVDVIRRSY
jgi:hypothetical protein